MRIILAQINPIVGSLAYNIQKICSCIDQAKKQKADLIVFPEMALIGYPPEDLLLLPSFIQAVQKGLQQVIDHSQGIAVVLGTVRENLEKGEKRLHNTAAIFEDGKWIGYQDKSLLPDYDVFSERRYFEPAHSSRLWTLRGQSVAITICEDIWQHAEAVEYSWYPLDPILELKAKKPAFVLNLSASPFYQGRQSTRLNVCKKTAQTLSCPVFLCNQVGGNDSLIFDGCSLYVNASGELLAYGKAFEEDLLCVDLEKKTPPLQLPSSSVEELYRALVLGIRDYFQKQGFVKATFGLSGGVDSVVVACLAVEALGKENVLALFMPSRYTREESVIDSQKVAQNLGISLKEISIEKPFQCFLDLLSPHFKGVEQGVAEENLQARIRGTLLMAFSNKFSYLVLSTGNKSEMAMGYATLYGDMCGGLAVLNDVTKDQVYALAHYINEKDEKIPKRVIERPPSAELRDHQKDTDSLPDYSIVDKVLRGYVEQHLSPEEIAEKHKLPISLVKELVRKIHLNEYKRRQAPPGLRVTKKAFTVGRRFPIVQHWNIS